jgi:hypothetical protein
MNLTEFKEKYSQYDELVLTCVNLFDHKGYVKEFIEYITFIVIDEIDNSEYVLLPWTHAQVIATVAKSLNIDDMRKVHLNFLREKRKQKLKRILNEY